MGIAKVSTMLRMVRDYRLDNDERAMFDFLVVKQEDFGLSKPFRHSIKQIQDAVCVLRRKQETTIKKFKSMGFLSVTTEYYQNNPYRAFFVDFSELSKNDVLSQVVKPGTETFKEFSAWIGELAKEQAKKEKPISKTKQRQMERDAAKAKENSESLYAQLCTTWQHRIQMFNNGELTKKKPSRGKNYAALAKGRNTMDMLLKLYEFYNNDASTINRAFIAYADDVLRGNIEPKNVLLYFLTYNDGEFSVFNTYLNYYTENYGFDM